MEIQHGWLSTNLLASRQSNAVTAEPSRELPEDGWSRSDRIGLANFLVVAITAIIVLWYTVEAMRLRRISERSLEDLRRQRDEDQLDRVRAAAPTFVMKKYTLGGPWRMEFINLGAPIRNVDVELNIWPYSWDVTPWLGNGDKLRVEINPEGEVLNAPPPDIINLKITYTDLLGVRRFQRVCVDKATGIVSSGDSRAHAVEYLVAGK